MNRIISTILVAMLALLLLFSITGCSGDDGVSKVKSDADAVKAIGEVSTSVEDVSAELDSIDKQLS